MTMKKINFYDTSALLESINSLKKDEEIMLSSITLEELESIKTANNKDEEIKYQARRALHFIEENISNISFVIFKEIMLDPIKKIGYAINNDTKIIACAIDASVSLDITFVTNDLSQMLIAQTFLHQVIMPVVPKEEQYTGFKDIKLTDEQMANFYQEINKNHFKLLINEYLIIRNENDEIVDTLCWTGEEHRHLSYETFSSMWFGNVKPLKGDPYQAMAADSLVNNQVTMISGRPGSGKTFLALSYLFSLLSKGKIDRIVVFCNPVVAKDAAKLGYYPGTVLEKLLATQAGAVLSSKLGSSLEVEHLVEQGKLVLIPAGDARGYEVPARSGVYIMESQNLTDTLLRMLLQRVGEDCKIIVDGDYNEQVDMDIYSVRNGMKIMSKAFRGQDIYGQIELQKIHRSKIAQIADKMMI